MNSPTKRILLPLGAGVLGAVFLTGVYLGIVSLAESPKHALDLFWQDKAFVIPIILGFGTQVGLYTLLKKELYMPLHVPAGGATTAAGGGMSTMAMVACCAHHVADVLPLVGLTAAATFLANWKIPFMVVGLLTNLIGIAVMLREIVRARRHAVAHLSTLEAAS
ncbi:MAG: hypothetical protein A2W37_09145 [Chloroflexi bacterium RBG_16_63_12]|nr:MAG: hypothetical protein A2W37_09145 [Chloroflexi bacterium RBG_16_63_12]